MQIAENILSLEGLSPTEAKVFCLNGLGLQTKEIADLMGVEYETSKSHIKNIKSKHGGKKDKELTARFWCKLSGLDYDEVKKQIIASLFLLVFICYIPFDSYQMRENRLTETRANRSIVVRRNDYTA